MHHIFQQFIDGLSASSGAHDLQDTLSAATRALDLRCFAYLALPVQRGGEPNLISNYPVSWTDHYLRQRYERLDPVIDKVLATPEPFEWGLEFLSQSLSKSQYALLDEAAQFGIRVGFTIPIHDRRGLVAAVTFAADERRAEFERCIKHHRHVLQLMAMYFHAHARRQLSAKRFIDGIALSPREFECLEWAARGKSAWEIGKILNISRCTATFHLRNAKNKFDVRTVCQAVARFAAARRTVD